MIAMRLRRRIGALSTAQLGAPLSPLAGEGRGEGDSRCAQRGESASRGAWSAPTSRRKRERWSLWLALGAILITSTSRDTASASAETLRVGKAGREAFSFVPADVGARTGIFKKHGLDIEISSFGGDARHAAGHGRRRHRHRARLRPRPRLHRQGLAGEGHRRHGGPAAAVRAGGAQRRLDQDRRRSQGPQGRRLDRRLGDELDRQRGRRARRAGATTASTQVPIGDDANRIAALKTKSIDARDRQSRAGAQLRAARRGQACCCASASWSRTSTST